MFECRMRREPRPAVLGEIEAFGGRRPIGTFRPAKVRRSAAASRWPSIARNTSTATLFHSLPLHPSTVAGVRPACARVL